MIYTCPIHPKVQPAHPAACSKCGMALEPMTATTDEDGQENSFQ